MKRTKKTQTIDMKNLPLQRIKKYALGGDYEKENGYPALWSGKKFTPSPKRSIAGKRTITVEGQKYEIGLSKTAIYRRI
jgi:hypothetical protein